MCRLDAVVRQDKELKKEEIVWLTPETGNLHSFTAMEDSAIFDILAPDYDHNSRYCNFYREVGLSQNPIREQNRLWKLFDQSKWSEDKEGEAGDFPMAPGEKKSVKYILPPFEMNIDVVPYKGEAFKIL